MPVSELFEWVAFERVFGPITIQERVDFAGAMAAWGAIASQGGKQKPNQLVPQWGGREAEEQTDDEMVAFMRGFMGEKKDADGND